MNKYRTHLCSELNASNLNNQVILSGWVDTIRDHGNLIFIDLRDNYGITQCVIENSHIIFKELEKLPLETVIKIEGKVLERSEDTVNKDFYLK